MNKLHLPSGAKLAAMLSLSFMVPFMVFLFTPLDLYLHNPTAFLVGWKFLLPQFLAFTFIGFAVMLAVFLLVWYKKVWLSIFLLSLCALFILYEHFVLYHFAETYVYMLSLIAIAMLSLVLLVKLLKEKAVDAVMLLVWGVFLAAYAQLLLMNGNMSLIVGDEATYDVFVFGNAFNFILWVIIAFLPFVSWTVLYIKKKEFKYESTLIFTALLVFGMQTSGLAVTALTTKLPAGFEDNPSYLSYAPVLKLSGNNDICVFMIDSLDVAYMTEVLEQYPELYEQLDGFTFYKNNISEFPNTVPSATTMLTQHYYTDGLTVSEYWENAWAQHSFIDTLKENGYVTNLIIDRVSTYGDTEQLKNRANNIVIGGNIKANIEAMLKVMGRMSLSRIAPYYLKRFFLRSIKPSFGNVLLRIDSPDGQDLVIWSGSDMKFYEYIKQNNMITNNSQRVFNFIHLNGLHVTGRYRYDAEKDTIVSGGNNLDVTRACFEILNVYFSKMKANDVYDNTTIIVLSDHGQQLSQRTAHSSLLIKPIGASGKLKTDTQSELSNKYFGASILEAAGLQHSNLGVSYFDIIGGASPPIRYYYIHSSDGPEKYILSGYYEISGDANDYANWKYIEK